MKWIEIIDTNREENLAYIAFCQDDPYYATNTDIKLDCVEALMRCKFDDGSHPFVRININSLEGLI